MNLQDALDRFVVQLQADGRAPNTIAQYRRHIRALGDGPVETITHEDVARFLTAPDTRRSRGPVTMNALRTSLRMFFRYLHESGVTAQNPARLVRRALCASPPPRALADDERDRFVAALQAAPDRDRALFTVLLTTGIRVGSCVALDAEDVDLERREITLRTTKGSCPVVVFMPATTAEVLRAYLKGRTSGALFPGRGSDRITSRHVHRRLAHWVAQAGIARAVSPHTLRHTFAISVYRRSGDIVVTQAALRHRNIRSTLIYAQVDGHAVRRAIGG